MIYLEDLLADLVVVGLDDPATTAARIGSTPGAIARALYRTRRPDLVPLARAFRAADRAARPDVYRAWDTAHEARRRGTRPSGPARRKAALARAAQTSHATTDRRTAA